MATLPSADSATEPARQPLLILGGGSFAIEALDIVEQRDEFLPLGFVVSVGNAATCHAGLPVYRLPDLPIGPTECTVVAAIISTARRAFVEQMTALGYRFSSLIHPRAIISPRARIEPGCIVGAGAIVAAGTHVKEHVILNRGSQVGHDNSIGSFSSVGPGVTLAGVVSVGEGTFLGTGAVIIDHLSIGAGAFVAAGATVVKPVPAHAMVAGVPARVIRTDVDGH